MVQVDGTNKELEEIPEYSVECGKHPYRAQGEEVAEDKSQGNGGEYPREQSESELFQCY